MLIVIEYSYQCFCARLDKLNSLICFTSSNYFCVFLYLILNNNILDNILEKNSRHGYIYQFVCDILNSRKYMIAKENGHGF